MVNGFGAGGAGAGDFELLARQYWNSWGEMMRNAAAAAPSGGSGMGAFPGMGAVPGMPGMAMPGMPAGAAMPGWNEAIAWWTQLAKGGGGEVGTGTAAGAGINDAIDRFNSQARGWFAQMQQVAAQLAGQDASASDIVQAWQRALGAQGDNPFAEMFRSMQGPGQHGFDQWIGQAAPYLKGFEHWQREGQTRLGQPTFGFAREHQERWQQLAQAQIEYQQHSQAYNTLMGEAARNAFARFETKLAERSEPGRQLDSARALFDLWIDAAEEAYAEIALSPRFRDAYGAMVNSQMRLRASLQREVEQACDLLGMPTRTEVDAAHLRIVQLERELRRMRDALESLGMAGEGDRIQGERVRRPGTGPSPAKRASGDGRKGATRRPAAARGAAAGSAAAKPGGTRAAGQPTAKKSAAKKTPVRRSTTGKAPARTASTPAKRATRAAKRTR